jgi:hypothetical protein
MDNNDRPISERTKVSLAVIFAIVPVIVFISRDHQRIDDHELRIEEMRGDVKTALHILTDMRLCMASNSCQVSTRGQPDRHNNGIREAGDERPVR